MVESDKLAVGEVAAKPVVQQVIMRETVWETVIHRHHAAADDQLVLTWVSKRRRQVVLH
jgi:hypothetical protein